LGVISNAGTPQTNAGTPQTNAGTPQTNAGQRWDLGQIGPILQFCQKVTKTLKKTENVVRFDGFYIFSLHFYDFRCRSGKYCIFGVHFT